MLPQWAALPDFKTPGSSNFKHYVVNFKTYRASHCNGGSGNCGEHQTVGGEGSCIENTLAGVHCVHHYRAKMVDMQNFEQLLAGSAIGKGASRR
jgi:hypothetical protein